MTGPHDVDWRGVFRDKFPVLSPSVTFKETLIPLPDSARDIDVCFGWDQSLYFDFYKGYHPRGWNIFEFNIDTGLVTDLGEGTLNNVNASTSGDFFAKNYRDEWINLRTHGVSKEVPFEPPIITLDGVPFRVTKTLQAGNSALHSYVSANGVIAVFPPGRLWVDYYPSGSEVPDGYLGRIPLRATPSGYPMKSIWVGTNLVAWLLEGSIEVISGISSRRWKLLTFGWNMKSVTPWNGKVYFLATRDGKLYLLETIN